MSFSVDLGLYVGSSTLEPAPESLVRALSRAEIHRTDAAPSGFQLTFHAERYGSGQDEPLLAAGQLAPFQRLALVATVAGTPQVLIDGYVTRQELAPNEGAAGSTLTVTGEDVSVKMDLFQVPLEWPAMGDFLIAEAILAKYLLIGIVPEVVPTLTDVIPIGYVPQQNSTDRCYVQQLAAQNGYLFYVKPGPSLGSNHAYWGPPVRTGTPQPALSVDLGPFTNVDSITFSYDALAPTINYGAVQVYNVPVPVLIGASTRTPPLAADPALGDYSALAANPLSIFDQLASLKIRGTLFQHQGLNIVQAAVQAQASTNLSTDQVVTVEGELSASRYGAVLEAPGLVAVRGAGASYDGLYYVKQVTHEITTVEGSWDYRQKFTLTREGVGSTLEEVPPDA